MRGSGLLTRRRLVHSTALAALPWLARPAAAGPETLEAYADLTSVRPGGQIAFFVRNPAGTLLRDVTVPLQIDRLGWPDQTMLRVSAVRVRNRVVPADAYAAGCRWPENYRLTVPVQWPSGLYYATVGSGSQACCVPFVVAPANGRASARVLVQVPVTTAQAYNGYGGKSLYGYNSSGGVAATKVSFDRPHTDPFNFVFDPWQAPFVRWLAKNGIGADFCTSLDLHAGTVALGSYALFVTAGHDEYWSREMRARVDAFVAAGGNLAVFGGNTAWFQVRLESNAAGKAHRTLVCYKAAAADPDPRPAYKTINWIDLVPPDPENQTFGLGWHRGASWTNGAVPRPETPWVLQRAEHWAFAGTGLAGGSSFGGEFVGYEMDALEFRLGTDGRPHPTALDGTPATLRVLALADATQWDNLSWQRGGTGEKSGHAAISIHSRGGAAGTVFNAGVTDWAFGLRAELDNQVPTPLSRITLNVVTRLSARHWESADVRRWHNLQASGDGVRYYYATGTDVPPGATLDGLAFRAFVAPSPGTVPIYRYHYPQADGDGIRYILSLDPNHGYGWLPDGVAFHAYAGDVPGSAAVFQHHIVQANGDGWRFMYSHRIEEPGWVFDGVAFFAPLA